MSEEKIQPELFSGAELKECSISDPATLARLENVESKGQYTAERLKSKRPEVYDAIVSMLSLNFPFQQISDVCKVHFYTVAAIADREPKIVKEAKEKYAAMAFTNSLYAQEKLREMLFSLDTKEKITTANIYQLAMASGIMADKANLFAGGVTQRIGLETEAKFDGDPDSYAERFLKKKEAIPVEGEIVEEGK